jgi:hypothetical protein
MKQNTTVLSKYHHIYDEINKADDIQRDIMTIKALVAIANELARIGRALDHKKS